MASKIDFSGSWKTQLQTFDGAPVMKSLLIDSQAESADSQKPAFMAPPPGAKPYHGFPLIDSSALDGFTLGAITNFLEADSPEGCHIGDAFVEGPDGRRAGIFWEVNREEGVVNLVQAPDEYRWGIYYITVPSPVRSEADLVSHFHGMLPILKQLYRP